MMTTTKATTNRLITAEERERLQSELLPVYRHYWGQAHPQPAYIVIDPERNEGQQVYAEYSGEIGSAVTARCYHGREAHIAIPPTAYGPDILAFIDTHADDILAIIEDYECRWDGRNLVGRWGQTASRLLYWLEREAQHEIREHWVMDDPADLGIDDEITADTDPEGMAEEIWAEIWEQIPADPQPEYTWVPTFTLDDLEEYIRDMVQLRRTDTAGVC